jgi:hypothetical protein
MSPVSAGIPPTEADRLAMVKHNLRALINSWERMSEQQRWEAVSDAWYWATSDAARLMVEPLTAPRDGVTLDA